MKNKYLINYKNRDFVVEKKVFDSLNSKGFGVNRNNMYILSVFEVLYLVEKDKARVLKGKNRDVLFKELLKISKVDLREYAVYCDLKTRGYVVKSGLKYGFLFRIYDKGVKEGDDHSMWLVDVYRESGKITFKRILGKNRVAHNTNKKMLFAVVDNEMSVTYLENAWKRM